MEEMLHQLVDGYDGFLYISGGFLGRISEASTSIFLGERVGFSYLQSLDVPNPPRILAPYHQDYPPLKLTVWP